MLTATAGLALGTLAAVTPADAGTITGASAKPRPIPRTLAVGRTARKGNLRVHTTSFKLTHLGVTWQGPWAHVRVRTSAGWSQWRAIHGCSAGRDGGAPIGGSAMLVVPGTVGYEVSVPGARMAIVAELNTIDGPVVALAAAVTSDMPLPDGTTCAVPYLSRAAWGADESYRFRDGVEFWPPEYFPVQTLTLHHTVTANNDVDPAATVRAIYHQQAMLNDGTGWGDIGYHLLIDEAGRVYEGRWSGSDAMPVFGSNPAPDGRPLMSVGAHVGSFNTGNIGVSMLGDFTSQLPTPAAMSSLTRVLRGLARVCHLDALGTTNYVNPVSGATRTVRTLSGHRDWAATECPGNTFYPQLPALRRSVAWPAPGSGEPLRPVAPRKPLPTLP